MAAIALRLRRVAVALSSALSHRMPPSIRALAAAPAIIGGPIPLRPHSLIHSQSFRSSPPSQLARRHDDSDDRDIDPNEILFEGCDYNHWLITMDFPKDPAPSPEEMVETYVQTLAKVVGSVEEAKKRMYACSTTTYNGFQAVMTEEMSKKFEGLPGVVFILPDSYIDPVNKQYGGDKYDNGVITPRPPPTQYRPHVRNNNQNRNYNQPRYDGQREPMPAEQGYRPRDQQSPMQGDGRNYGPLQQNYSSPQQNYSPPQQNFGPPQQNYSPPQQNFVQGGGRDLNQRQGGNYVPQEQRNFAQGGGGMYSGPPLSGGHDQGLSLDSYGEHRQGSASSYTSDNRQGVGSGHGVEYQSKA